MNPQADLLDDEAGPRVGQKLVLSDHLTRAVDQKPQDIQRPAPQLDGHTILLEQPRLVVEGERPEGDGVRLREAPLCGSFDHRSMFQARSLAPTRKVIAQRDGRLSQKVCRSNTLPSEPL